MLAIYGRSVLAWQIRELAKCGIDDVSVLVGFGAEHVEQFLTTQSISLLMMPMT